MSDFEFTIRQEERQALIQARRRARIKRNRQRYIHTLSMVKKALQTILGLFMGVLGIGAVWLTHDLLPAVLILPLAVAVVRRQVV